MGYPLKKEVKVKRGVVMDSNSFTMSSNATKKSKLKKI
jgi:hypothetical protein